MNRISMFVNLLKARFGSFTEEEFDALCKEYSEKASVFSDEGNEVGKVLTVYFRRKTPTLTELNVIYRYNDELRWLYLCSLSDKRKLTTYEQEYLASFMNFGLTYRFPQQLDTQAVAHLFEVGDVSRITTYVRDFALPEYYELELIKRYVMQKPYANSGKSDKRNYRGALEQYLSNRKPGICKSVKVQNELLKFADGAIWEKLCANQSMTENVLERNTIRELIANGYRKVVKVLLMHSFIPTAELQRYLLSAFPVLKWELEISKLRYALRKLELETGEFWGVEAPDFEEMKLIEKEMLSDETPRGIAKIAHKKIVMCEPVTPYFCAWVVNEYSPAGEEMYTCIRKFAESCREKYGKSA